MEYEINLEALIKMKRVFEVWSFYPCIKVFVAEQSGVQSSCAHNWLLLLTELFHQKAPWALCLHRKRTKMAAASLTLRSSP